MSSKITYLAVFTVGIAIGGTAVWQTAKKKYERIAEEEIRSVKEKYSQRQAVVVKSAETAAVAAETKTPAQQREESVVEYAARLRREGYLPSETTEKKEEKTMPATDAPYIISPEEFGMIDGYSRFSLTYYSDGILTDENDEVVDDAEEIVGSDFHNHFGEYEDDSVFVRNDKLKSDYEILLDQRPYSEILKAKPYLNKGE